MNKTLILIIVVLVVLGAAMGYRKAIKSHGPKLLKEKSEAFYVSGNVLIKRKDAARWEQAVRDAAVRDGDVISAADGSSLEVRFGKEQKNFFAVKENTVVELNKIETAGDKQLDLKRGSLISSVGKLDPDSTFEVRTPTAVCGVLGTGFETEATKDATVLRVYEHEVSVRGRGIMNVISPKEIRVSEGSMTRIEKNRPPQEPAPLSGEDLKKWKKWKGELDSHLFRTFYVFHDEDSAENHYHPSGWVGDYDAIRRVSWKENPYSGKNCLRFRYTGRPTQGAGWVGVYWQNPVNNWGDVKGGFNLKGAKRLTFWARGEKGGEVLVRVGAGGIGGEHPDTLKVEIGPITLTDKWTEYAVDLSGKDLACVSGGFYWMTDKVSNPDGAVFYIDEIKYE